MSKPRTKSRWGWWITAGLAFCLLAAGLRVGLPLYRRNVALATVTRLKFTVKTSSQRPEWLRKYDRWGWTNGLDSVNEIYDWHYTGSRLSETEIDEFLSQIRVFHELKRLDMFGINLQDRDLSVLEYFPNLESLNLEMSSVTGDGMKYLASSLKIHELILTNTEVDDAGLSRLALHVKLARLDLDGTHVSDAGLKHLAQLPNLNTLNVSNTAVTEAGLDELLKSHPALSVTDD